MLTIVENMRDREIEKKMNIRKKEEKRGRKRKGEKKREKQEWLSSQRENGE